MLNMAKEKLVKVSDIKKIWRLKHTPECMVIDPEGQFISLNNINYLDSIEIEFDT